MLHAQTLPYNQTGILTLPNNQNRFSKSILATCRQAGNLSISMDMVRSEALPGRIYCQEKQAAHDIHYINKYHPEGFS